MSRTFHKTLAAYRAGAQTMAREYYASPDVLAEEREKLFANMWHCAGRISALALAGKYVVRDIAGESIILVRGNDGELRAFFNVCRHRGTRLCSEAAGQF